MHRIALRVALSLSMLAVLGVMPAAAAEPGNVLIATAADHRTLVAGDIAASAAIGIVYQKKTQSYLRWSEDGGQTFDLPRALRNGRSAASPRLAACGSRFWALSSWLTTEGTRFAVEYFDVDGSSARLPSQSGFRPDIACNAEVAAITWLTGDEHGHVAVIGGNCPTTCTPAHVADIGEVDSSAGNVQIAAVDDGFVATWVKSGLAIQHFRFQGTSDGFVVSPGPVVMLMAGKSVWSPVIAGDGARVAVAYSRRGQTHMRISEDRGATFGQQLVVSSYCTDCEGGSAPSSIDARDGRILVEVIKGGGIPPAVQTVGKLTRNGDNWRTISSRGGSQLGVLTDGIAAEVWDQHVYADPIYGDVPQKIYFGATPLN